MTTIFALCAAFCNALYVATQHIASTRGTARRASGARLVAQLFQSPLWLFGWAAAVGGFVFQAAALDKGQLSVVQALLVTELVFSLVLRKLWIRQAIPRAAWGSAVLTCVGLAAFVVIDEPHGGVQVPSAHAWVGALAVFGGTAAAMTLAARRGSPARKAALYATAAALVTALVATFIKAATETLTTSGVAAVFTHWQLYALLVGGIAGVVLVQAALHVGPLSVSQPLLVIVDPCASVLLSIWLFQERYTNGSPPAAGSTAGFIVMCAGVVILTRTTPPTMTATARIQAEADHAQAGQR